MKHIEKYLGISLLLFAVGFNLWTYRSEPTAMVDPNDNTFQYALVDRTNQIWDYANSHCKSVFPTNLFCKLSVLTDHWVPNWAEGYNLPYYYSHLPQVAIVASWRAIQQFTFNNLQTTYPLFMHYHYVIYLLLCLFPLSLFVALRMIGLSWIASGIGALVASHLSTDGLYGLDPSSFLWRGFGLSSQLFAMMWFPLAIASTWKYFQSNSTTIRSALKPILFLTLTTAGHLGIGIVGFMTVGLLAISTFVQSILTHSVTKTSLNDLKISLWKLVLVFGGVGLLLGYWILPILKDGNYHNISVWDPIWKFDSYGYREILKNLFNGDLFDFGRFPILTLLVGIGIFSAARGNFFADRFSSSTPEVKQQNNHASSGSRKNLYERNDFSFALLFVFWLILYFGRTTWGGLMNLIPGMSEFHISRFIVGVHMSGLFLIPITIEWLFSRVPHKYFLPIGFVSIVLIMLSVYPQTLRYAKHNDYLVDRANTNYVSIQSDSDKLIDTLKIELAKTGGRVYFGRGGNWGRNFRVAETPYYLYASTFGIPTVLWLPQTWSPNSDTEQYFSDNKLVDYTLYNVRYVVTPTDLGKDQIQPFWKPLATGKTWKLYEVETDGFITAGVRPAVVSVDKETYTNLVHLWIISDAPANGLYPELTFDKNYPKTTGIPNFRMLDSVTYKIPNGTNHALFAETPRYEAETARPKVISQSNDHDMIFTARVEVPKDCKECIVVLRQTYHPSWTATIDEKPATTISVFPFYTAVKIESSGNHEVVFTYKSSGIKIALLLVSLASFTSLIWLSRSSKKITLR